MMKCLKQFVALSALVFSSSAFALEVNGVMLPYEVVQPGSERTLVLNGAGTRDKFVFDIYVGALYLSSQSSEATSILADTSPKRVSMHFLYDEIGREKMVTTWNAGFEANLSEYELITLKEEIASFNTAFGRTVEGDVVVIDFLPDGHTVVTINGNEKVQINSNEFQPALLSIWLGDSPADAGLKRAMLGKSEE